VIADRVYDHRPQRHELRKRGIRTQIARRQSEHGSGLGRYRWVVERTFAWLHQFKRLLVRYDRRADMHQAFPRLGLLPRLLPTTPELILIRALSDRAGAGARASA
jgi:transposase